MTLVPADNSAGYERRAREYIAHRSDTGAQVVRDWARSLPPRAAVLDIGCGHGVPVAAALVDEGLDVYAIDPAPTLVEAFHTRFPDVPVECSTLEDSKLFNRSFDAAIAWGILFLLKPEAQRALMARVSASLRPGGHFLFTAPAQECEWQDVLTDAASTSLGSPAYRRAALETGLVTLREGEDEGGNHYYIMVKRPDMTAP